MAKHEQLKKYIKIRKAAEHNLKEIDLDVPRDEFVVFTGLSGSGKSSLAFDTIYAEGQRRYMESLSSYARQFLGQMEKPNVDAIEGLPPAISIDQKSTNRNPRSTVGTVTEIYDYFRLLYARIGIPHCPNCGKEIRKQTVRRRSIRWQMRSWSCRRGRGFSFWLRLCVGARDSMSRCSSLPAKAAMSVLLSMVICMSYLRRFPSKRIKNTISK